MGGREDGGVMPTYTCPICDSPLTKTIRDDGRWFGLCMTCYKDDDPPGLSVEFDPKIDRQPEPEQRDDETVGEYLRRRRATA